MSAIASTSKQHYQVLADLCVDLVLVKNPYQFQLEHLFQVAARVNKKRSFLFVSKLLGKHLAQDPKICLLTGHLLALRYSEVVHGKTDIRTQKVINAMKTNQNTSEVLSLFEKNPIELLNSVIFIGFAETATALGHAVFSSFSLNAKYIHTTREKIENLQPTITFEEEHSHATSHRVYALEKEFFQEQSEVVLIDDELTTGKTAVNIIRKIKEVYPEKKFFTIISILDWRTQVNREQFRALERELMIKIHEISLIEGLIEVKGTPTLEQEKKYDYRSFFQQVATFSLKEYLCKNMYVQLRPVDFNDTNSFSPYLLSTGRFGLTREKDKEYTKMYKNIGNHLQTMRKGKRTLVLGTGEFMYLPMKIASFMGDGISLQSTTRSPIYIDEAKPYLIQQKFTFHSPDNDGITNYLYNIEPNQYDDIFIFIERSSSEVAMEDMLNELMRTYIPFITIVTI